MIAQAASAAGEGSLLAVFISAIAALAAALAVVGRWLMRQNAEQARVFVAAMKFERGECGKDREANRGAIAAVIAAFEARSARDVEERAEDRRVHAEERAADHVSRHESASVVAAALADVQRGLIVREPRRPGRADVGSEEVPR